MTITFESYQKENLAKLTDIWNVILADGIAFPGTEMYNESSFHQYLLEQDAVNCLFYDGELVGYYVLHPNNIGRCSHVANASFCIAKEFRGKKLADALVKDCLKKAQALGFRGMQFNAVVVSNQPAIHTYQKNGFEIIGTIPQGFHLKDGTYSDIYIMYCGF